jgi:hypothetical protein
MDANTLNIIFGVVGTLVGIYGIVLTIRGIKKKEPVYEIESVNVFSDYSSKYKNLTVSYKGEKVENFTVSKVLFFNKGAETLHGDDIRTRNQLRIEAYQGDILDATVLQANNGSSDFKVTFVNAMVMIDFDYLNQNQGAVIEVIHTGLLSTDIGVVGDIKGVQRIKNLSETANRNSYIVTIMLIIASSLLIYLAWQRQITEKTGDAVNAALQVAAWAFGGVLSGVIAISLMKRAEKPSRRSGIPRGLEKFNEEISIPPIEK